LIKLFQKFAQVDGARSPSSRVATRETSFAKKKNEAKNWELYPLGATPNFWLGFSAKS